MRIFVEMLLINCAVISVLYASQPSFIFSFNDFGSGDPLTVQIRMPSAASLFAVTGNIRESV